MARKLLLRADKSLRIVVAFQKPVGEVSVGIQRVSQCRHCLCGQASWSSRNVKRNSVLVVNNRMTERSGAP